MSSDPVKWFLFLFYLQITSGTETRKERSSQSRKGRKRERKNDSQTHKWRKIAPSIAISPLHRSRSREALRRSRSCLRADRSPSSNPVASLSSFFSQFDRIWWFFFSWVLFVFLCWRMNDIIYFFGNQENVRKCEQQVENVFSMVFSRTQPNIKKYFSKHFLKCNKTYENIFLSGK